eukprot:TRINITY_DN3897_c0_g1_i2.p1 TRINITY_DN3897_c0_g1~~TRINITY_DN3897_c0_g1_i2.p1  ORF type:complete len:224 (-),score=27.76 TRINITY_DN3897_c0_g1_i2:91-762(-)
MLKIITHSNEVNPKDLNPGLCYLQITAVKPYFESWELKERVTYYDKNYNINQFIFETPYTKEGKSHAESMSNQYKRKTILRTKTYFPYVKNRIEVTSKQTINITPVENALELIEQRSEMLLTELNSHLPNLKTLQPVLQGAVRVSVNAGPLEIAKTFLVKENNNFDQQHIQSLRVALEKFLHICYEALEKNKELSAPDQWDFHLELEDGFNFLRKEILALIDQ